MYALCTKWPSSLSLMYLSVHEWVGYSQFSVCTFEWTELATLSLVYVLLNGWVDFILFVQIHTHAFKAKKYFFIQRNKERLRPRILYAWLINYFVWPKRTQFSCKKNIISVLLDCFVKYINIYLTRLYCVINFLLQRSTLKHMRYFGVSTIGLWRILTIYISEKYVI